MYVNKCPKCHKEGCLKQSGITGNTICRHCNTEVTPLRYYREAKNKKEHKLKKGQAWTKQQDK